MKIEQLPSGSYRVRKTKKGKTYTLTFDKKPRKSDAEDAINELIFNDKDAPDRKTFRKCALEYIQIKGNILSPSTIRVYNAYIKKTIDNELLDKNIFEITPIDIQVEINRLAADHSPKSVRNTHGFISAVFKLYRPDIHLNTTLPQKIKFEPYIPSEEEIRKIIKASENTMYHIPFQLGVLGMRRSEICALTKDDIKGNSLHINKAMIQKSDNSFEIVQRNKTTDGKRTIYIPTKLAKEISRSDTICSMHPNNLVKGLYSYQKKLGIQKFRFHDLRHFYCSYAHEQGMSDADIMATGGWKSDYTMKSVYRHSLEKTKTEKQKEIATNIFS